MVGPATYWRNNLLGSLNLFEACISNGCKNVIFSPTCATYGDHDNFVLSEASEQRQCNAYGALKRTVEEILKQISISFGLKHEIFGYFFNLGGGNPDGNIGQ